MLSRNQKDNNYINGNGMTELPSDMLEEVISNLPTLDLLSASCVSTVWLQAVRSSLHRRPRLFPWLLLRCLRHPKSSSYSIHALDPYSHTWLSTTRHNPATKQPSPIPNFLCGSTRDKLYTLCASKMAIFQDPFGKTSQSQTVAKGPKVWRQDPLVAEVDRWIVVAGGGFLTDLDDGDEEGAVEIYDKQADKWELAEPMPWIFEGSTYATWLSVAVSDNRLYVIDKKTGWMSQFDPKTKKWGPTQQMMPHQQQPVSAWSIGTIGNERGLLLVGAGKEDESGKKVMKVRLWEVNRANLQVIGNKSEEMPEEMVNFLFPDFDCIDDARQSACSVQVFGTELGGYIFDPANLKNGVVMYQLSMERAAGKLVDRWEWVPCSVTVGKYCQMEEISVGCSPVTLNELARCF